MPGDAMLPGSTIFSVTMPSKGAVIVAKDSVVLACVAGGAGAVDGRRGLQPGRTHRRRAPRRSAAPPWRRRVPARWPTAWRSRPAMRSWDARARARPASAAWSSAAAALAPCSAASGRRRAALAPAARSSPSSTMSAWPARTRSPGATRTSRTGARMRAVIVAVVRAWTTPPASNASATSAIATRAIVTANGLCRLGRSGGGPGSRASSQRRAHRERCCNARDDDVMTRDVCFMAFLSLVAGPPLR